MPKDSDISSWWLSTEKMTVYVETDANDRIINAAPIVNRFIGQPLDNLLGWLSRQGGLRKSRLGDGTSVSSYGGTRTHTD